MPTLHAARACTRNDKLVYTGNDLIVQRTRRPKGRLRHRRLRGRRVRAQHHEREELEGRDRELHGRGLQRTAHHRPLAERQDPL